MSDDFYMQCAAVIGESCVDRSQDPPVLIPSSSQVLTELIRCAAAAKQGLRFVGGGTMPITLSDQQVPVVSLAGLDGVPEMNVDDRLIIAQAGVTADRIRALAEEYGLSMPFGITSGEHATIGGMYMTDAYVGTPFGSGRMHSWITGVTAVASTGDLVTFGGRTVKNVTGFDVTRMLAGTRGLYAVAVQLILKALPAPEYRRAITFNVPAGTTCTVLKRIGESMSRRMEQCDLLAPDGMGGTVTISVTLEGFNRLVKDRARELTDMVSGMHKVDMHTENPEKSARNHRKHSQTITNGKMYTVTVPPAALPVMLSWLESNAPQSPVIAHVLHGRIHVGELEDEAVVQLREQSLALGGTQPVAWGKELSRGNVSPFTETEMSLARSLKQQLDPHNMFNPHLWI